MVNEARLMTLHYPGSDWISGALPSKHHSGSAHVLRSIFDNPRSHVSATNSTALLLTICPHHSNLSLCVASGHLGLNDLIPALRDFCSEHSYTAHNGHHISTTDCHLSFQAVNIWEKFWIQQRSIQDVQAVAPIQTVQAMPPSDGLPFGHRNPVLVNHESGDLLLSDPQSKRA